MKSNTTNSKKSSAKMSVNNDSANDNDSLYAEYSAHKAELLASTGDERLSDDVAWNLSYGE